MSVFIHKTAEVNKKSIIGEGSKIKNNVHIKGKVKIGKNCEIGKNSSIKGNVKIKNNVKIGDNCIIQGKINIGKKNSFGNGVIIQNNVDIGKNNIIEHNCCLGIKPVAGRDFKNEIPTYLKIGDNNVFETNVLVYSNILENSLTSIGNHNSILSNVTIHHDCKVHNNVSISDNCSISGHINIFDNVVIGTGSVFHQFSTIGAFSMIGMGSSVSKDIPPFITVFGNKIKFHKINKIGLERNNFINEYENIIKYYNSNGTKIGDKIKKYINEFLKYSKRDKVHIRKIRQGNINE